MPLFRNLGVELRDSLVRRSAATPPRRPLLAWTLRKIDIPQDFRRLASCPASSLDSLELAAKSTFLMVESETCKQSSGRNIGFDPFLDS
jgi:hypothetical protein